MTEKYAHEDQMDFMTTSANRAQMINQDSGNVEWYTPKWITDRIHRVLGGIDLDPASSTIANELVGAKAYYTIDDDGLSKPWFGNVWMNHPFGRGEKPCHKNAKGHYKCTKLACKKRGHHIDFEVPGNKDWINKLVSEVKSGNVKRAANISFANTSENWFRPMYDYPQLFLYDRVNFVDVNGNEIKGAPKGCAITFYNVTKEEIEAEFIEFGKVK